MNSTPIEEARRTLELAANAVIAVCQSEIKDAKASGVGLLEAIHRFVRAIRSNLHLDRARLDCQAELLREKSALRDQKVQIVTKLRALRQEAQAAFPVLDASAISSDIPSIESHYSLARFDVLAKNALAEQSDGDDPGSAEGEAGHETFADVLWVILDQGLPKLGIDPTNDQLADLLKRLGSLRNDLRRALRSQFLLARVHPATKWIWLDQVVTDSNPTTNSMAWILGEMGQVPPYSAYFRFLYASGGVQTEDLVWLEGFRPEVAIAVVAVRSEFEMRLGTRASAAVALQRYARRCRRLRLDELGTKLGAGPQKRKQREVILTRDAAVFLYDQGFDVVIEQSHGQHRYDILAPSLLVEAKIYSAKRRSLDAVVDGLKQIHQYATALASEGPTPEPILILFRLDGPVADPLEEYTIGNLRVSIVWVDLGPAIESGSHARAPDLSVTNEAIDRKLKGRRMGRKGHR